MTYSWESLGTPPRYVPPTGQADTVEEAAAAIGAALCLGKRCSGSYADHVAAARAAVEALRPGQSGELWNATATTPERYGFWWDGPRPAQVARTVRITRMQTPAPAPLAEGGRR